MLRAVPDRYQECLVAGIRLAGGNRVAVHLARERRECGQASDFDVADDVGQAHDGPNRQRGLGSLGRVADEILDVRKALEGP